MESTAPGNRNQGHERSKGNRHLQEVAAWQGEQPWQCLPVTSTGRWWICCIEDKPYRLPVSSSPRPGGVQLLIGGATSAGVIIQNGEVAVLPPRFIIGSSRSFRDVHQSLLQMAGGGRRPCGLVFDQLL